MIRAVLLPLPGARDERQPGKPWVCAHDPRAPGRRRGLVVEGRPACRRNPRLRDVIEPTIAVITMSATARRGSATRAVMQEKLALVEEAGMACRDPNRRARRARRARRGPTVVGDRAGRQVRPDRGARRRGHPASPAGHAVTLPLVGFHNRKPMVASRWGGGGRRPGARGRGPRGGAPHRRGAVLSLALTVIDDTYNANPGSLRWR